MMSFKIKTLFSSLDLILEKLKKKIVNKVSFLHETSQNINYVKLFYF